MCKHVQVHQDYILKATILAKYTQHNDIIFALFEKEIAFFLHHRGKRFHTLSVRTQLLEAFRVFGRVFHVFIFLNITLLGEIFADFLSPPCLNAFRCRDLLTLLILPSPPPSPPPSRLPGAFPSAMGRLTCRQWQLVPYDLTTWPQWMVKQGWRWTATRCSWSCLEPYPSFFYGFPPMLLIALRGWGGGGEGGHTLSLLERLLNKSQPLIAGDDCDIRCLHIL